jgi:hypothetical protein
VGGTLSRFHEGWSGPGVIISSFSVAILIIGSNWLINLFAP